MVSDVEMGNLFQELFQVGALVVPLAALLILLEWEPATSRLLRLKGGSACILFGAQVWVVRQIGGLCFALGIICPEGQRLVAVNPPLWGLPQDCQICVPEVGGGLAVTLNIIRPTLAVGITFLAAVCVVLVLRQCLKAANSGRLD